MSKFEVQASLRNDLGKGASRRLRRADKVPGIVYGAGKEPSAIVVEHKSIAKSLENEAFYSHILTLKTDKESDRVILKDVQRHPYKARIMHVDFQRVRADEKLNLHVPLHFKGGAQAPGVKEGGLISHLETDVEVTCLPDDLPESLEIDISQLGLNDTLHFSDIPLPKGVEVVALTHGNDRPIVAIHMPKAEVEIPTEAPTAVEVPATAQKSEDSKDGKKEGEK